VAVRVAVNPELLAWARERSGVEPDDLARRFPKLAAWEEGDLAPTLKQLERFAHVTKTPVGYLFLQEPPDEPLPIPDYRTRLAQRVARPSPDLLDTIFQCLQRQEWYREFARATGRPALPFVGSLSTATPIVEAATIIRDALGFEVDARGPTWSDTLRLLIDQAEELGILVMVNGVVGNNTHRKLNPDEFQGFALVDPIAPVVFVNGADTKAAQIFTLAHELAHVWVGESALSDAAPFSRPAADVEQWCNTVSAELLVPLALVRQEFEHNRALTDELERLAARFRVSTLVVLRRVHDASYIGSDEYHAAYEAELERLRQILEERGGASGGNFYNTQPLRVSRRFARAVIDSTLQGQTLYRDAFQMLGFRKVATFHELAARLRDD
jgi:Zn-dependent peptidase ImmA (M78 family)/transcriptional regulator with XRE-family HTH domain